MHLFATKSAALILFLALLPRGPVSADEQLPVPPSFEEHVQPFLKQHCVRCHGSRKQNAERRFDAVSGSIDNDTALIQYQDILDQLNLGAMPPADEIQPTDNERRLVVDWLTSSIANFHSSRTQTRDRTILRRLNSREYRNTVRDLFRLNTLMFDPSEGFPRDQTVEHLDNIGDTLVTSGYLLQQYLTAAESVVHKSIYPVTQPKVQKWTFEDGFHQQPEIDQVHRKTNNFDHMTLYDVVGADKPEGAYGPIHAFENGVPFDGVYEIQIKAEALHRSHPYEESFVGTDKSEPLRLGIVPGDHTVGPLHLSQPVEPLLAEIELADELQSYTVRVWLDAGYTPRFTFRNGLMDARNLWGKLVKKYADQFPKPVRSGIVEHRFNAIKYGRLPQIHIHEIEIEGPFYDEWPTRSQQAVFGSETVRILKTNQITKPQMRALLIKFATRAYRRQPSTDEINHILKVIETQLDRGRSSIEAYADGLKAVLCSPSFLYLEQPSEAGQSATALASRLSYFLWSSMPDEELLHLALGRDGEAPVSELRNQEHSTLFQPEVLNAQIDRMLADTKSDAFVNGFLGSWLTLRELGATPPDRDRFRDYYRFDLGAAMLEETRTFTRHLIENNLSINHFLDSSYTFVNKPLARHYGIPAPPGTGFQKVTLADRRRGGLLGQSSVLTVTANGIDTSPVVRGVWVLENILGTPPAPPPPDVEPLDPDIRGAKTIREQLAKHRLVASCNDCHRKIDPMGFALENFDPIGRWRTNYSNKQIIDASGELPNGSKYDDIVSFKHHLSDQQNLFARALTSKLLAYAAGRQIHTTDRPTIDQITDRLTKDSLGLRDLIKLVAGSNPILGTRRQATSD